jgi:hypothetical protein
MKLNMPADSPRCTTPHSIPSFSESSVSTGFAATTPIEPVKVPGCATILSAAAAT